MLGEGVVRPPGDGTTSLSSAVTDLASDTDLDLSQLTTLFPCPRIPRTPPGEGITNMDFYGADRKLSEMGDRDFTEFLDSDMFNSTVSSHIEAMCIQCLLLGCFWQLHILRLILKTVGYFSPKSYIRFLWRVSCQAVKLLLNFIFGGLEIWKFFVVCMLHHVICCVYSIVTMDIGTHSKLETPERNISTHVVSDNWTHQRSQIISRYFANSRKNDKMCVPYWWGRRCAHRWPKPTCVSVTPPWLNPPSPHSDTTPPHRTVTTYSENFTRHSHSMIYLPCLSSPYLLLMQINLSR